MPDVNLTRALRGADFTTGYRIILSKILLSIRPRTKKRGSVKRKDSGRLQDQQLRETYKDMDNLGWDKRNNVVRSAGLTEVITETGSRK